MVADGADPVLGLPRFASRDRRLCVECVVPGEPDEVVGLGSALSRGRLLDDGAEHPAKQWSQRTEPVSAGERDVDLQSSGEQEPAVDRVARIEVKVMKRAKLPIHEAAPLVERVLASGPIRDAEVEVHVRPTILCTARTRACQRGSDDRLVILGALEQQVSDRAPLLGREHTVRICKTIAVARFSQSCHGERDTSAAGVTVPVLYQHFDSKSALFVCILEKGGEQLIARVVSVAQEGTPEQFLRATFEAFFGALGCARRARALHDRAPLDALGLPPRLAATT